MVNVAHDIVVSLFLGFAISTGIMASIPSPSSVSFIDNVYPSKHLSRSPSARRCGRGSSCRGSDSETSHVVQLHRRREQRRAVHGGIDDHKLGFVYELGAKANMSDENLFGGGNLVC